MAAADEDQAPPRRRHGRGGASRHAIFSVKAEFRADHPQFRGFDQRRMADDDLMDCSIELFRPEFEKFPQFRKFWLKVVLLPDEGLNDRRMVWHPIEDIGRCDPIALQLATKVF
jgi:hypothetical protein